VRRSVGFAFLALLALSAIAHGQYQAPSERLLITAQSASTRPDGDGSIVELNGNVTIELDRARLTADSAVIWLPAPSDNQQPQEAQIALIGDARVEQKIATRTANQLFVTAQVRGSIRLTAQHRDPPAEPSDLYRSAVALRDLTATALAPQPATMQAEAPAPITQPFVPTTGPAEAFTSGPPPQTQPTTKPAREPSTRPTTEPVDFAAGEMQTAQTSDGLTAVVLSGGVTLFQPRAKGDIIEMRAERAVLFTTVKDIKELSQSSRSRRIQDSVKAAYLEGDVQIIYTSPSYIKAEQRLLADRVYYDFVTDRAILTDAVIHTLDVKRQVPIIVRAKLVRQLARGEYKAEKATLTTSSFALPSMAIAADRLYVKSEDVPNEATQQETYYNAQNVKFPIFGVPVFYLPSASGTSDGNGGAMREIGFQDRTNFGYGPSTEWGLFETLGAVPPHDLDAAYRLDYYSERGPAFGISGAYQGGYINDTTKQPWDFTGDFESYFVDDMGHDDLNRGPIHENDGDTLRGRLLWEHTHYFPDDWEAQLRAGWVSDATFEEEWFRRDYETQLPLDVSAYLKHQQDTEAFTLLFNIDPSHVVTSAEGQQEQFEVEQYPEIGYRRIGDGIVDDQLTLFSDNTLDALKFQQSTASLVDQGYSPKNGITPGLPSLGTTGVYGHTVFRENFREEVDYPFTLGPLRVVPYGMGILTQYSNSPMGGEITRLMAGAGVRLSTAFWKIDPNAESDLFDIHQIRHVIQPELNLYTSAQNISHDDVYIYDEPVDAVNGISAAQIGLRQTWETKRGAPGEWRNVDLFSLNVDADFFADKPPAKFLNPANFRGEFFPSLPEASIPRNAVNAQAMWRLSDETVMLGDMSENLDKGDLATAAIGVLVRRNDRLSYYLENRYVQDLNADITSMDLNYTLSDKYVVGISQSFNFSTSQDISSGVTIQRNFDTFFLSVTAYHDLTTGINSFSITITPVGLSRGAGTGALSNQFRQ
jgi:hypothetical protein